jgi:hypothetical protein
MTRAACLISAPRDDKPLRHGSEIRFQHGPYGGAWLLKGRHRRTVRTAPADGEQQFRHSPWTPKPHCKSAIRGPSPINRHKNAQAMQPFGISAFVTHETRFQFPEGPHFQPSPSLRSWFGLQSVPPTSRAQSTSTPKEGRTVPGPPRSPNSAPPSHLPEAMADPGD